MLCDDLEGWDGGEDKREIDEGGEIYIYMCVCVCVCVYTYNADLHCCTAETNTRL